MSSEKVDMFIMANSNKFDPMSLPAIKDKLNNNPEKVDTLAMAGFKDPMMMLAVSFVAGPLGVDRFMLGQTGLGIAKLLTCGGLSIWTIVDLFLIMGLTRKFNSERVNEIL